MIHTFVSCLHFNFSHVLRWNAHINKCFLNIKHEFHNFRRAQVFDKFDVVMGGFKRNKFLTEYTSLRFLFEQILSQYTYFSSYFSFLLKNLQRLPLPQNASHTMERYPWGWHAGVVKEATWSTRCIFPLAQIY